MTRPRLRSLQRVRVLWLAVVLTLVAGGCTIADDPTIAEPTPNAAAATPAPLPTSTSTPERAAPTQEDSGSAPDDGTDPASPISEPTEQPGPADPDFPTSPLVPISTYRVDLPPVDYSIDWSPCADGECGELEVPLDHTVAGGPTISLSVARVRAAEPGQRIGSLLINFGGPGAGGTSGLESFASGFPRTVQNRFDIVSWDPRGTGGAAPFDCPDSGVEDVVHDAEDGFADDVEIEVSRRTPWTSCTSIDGFLDNLGSVASVRDMDAIRQAVGDEQLTYLGYSYGTQLGWMYATLFPENTRALVLDAPVAPGRHNPDGWITQLENFDLQLERLDSLCDAAEFCAVSNEGFLETVDRLRDELADQPLNEGRAEEFTEADLLSVLSTVAYLSPGVYGEFVTSGLANLDDGDPAIMQRFLNDFSYDGYGAVTCADAAGLNSEAELEAYIAERFAVSDLMAALPDIVLCDQWPARTQPLPEIDTSEAAPLLIIGGTEDAATPYPGALKLASLIPNGTLLTYVGAGHGAVQSNPCVDGFFERYVVDLELPDAGTECLEGRGTIGVLLDGNGDDGPGIPITSVGPGTPAEAAGLEDGDVLLRFAGVVVNDRNDLPEVPGGQPIEVVVRRGSDELVLTVVPVSPDWT